MRVRVRVVLLALFCLAALPARGADGAIDLSQALHVEKSLYRNIVVTERDGVRCMAFGRYRSLRQTCVSLTEPEVLVFPFARMMLGALYLNPQPRKVLMLGLGGGTLPMTLTKIFPEIEIDAVEIDPAVTRMARRFFSFDPPPTVRVHEMDGRVFVKRRLKDGATYDLVMIDVFDHEYIPEHFLTTEFLDEVKGLLAPGGVVAANTFSSGRLLEHENATYRAVFGDFYSLRMRNRVILATAGPLPDRDAVAANSEAFEDAFRRFGNSRNLLLPLFQREAGPFAARPLTDQYSPSNLLNR